jgi:hypothetical protein
MEGEGPAAGGAPQAGRPFLGEGGEAEQGRVLTPPQKRTGE